VTSSIRRALMTLAPAVVIAVAITATLAACSGGASGPATKPARKSRRDFMAQATDFRNLHTMTKVRGFYIDNRLGHLKEAVAVANSPKGGVYPVGTIIQLVPQEAMVKREKGFSPRTKDWEFFFLSVSADGTVIQNRGTTEVVNRFGGNCASCHQAATARFDGVCEHNHGCAPLPIGDDVIHSVQEADPRPLG
jgi:mono/diheme cytochrome c family protein